MAISTVRTVWPKSGNFGQNRVKSENSTILPAVLCKFLSKKYFFLFHHYYQWCWLSNCWNLGILIMNIKKCRSGPSCSLCENFYFRKKKFENFDRESTSKISHLQALTIDSVDFVRTESFEKVLSRSKFWIFFFRK